MCGRSHGMADVREAISAVKEARVQSWSLDLMCGLPTLSMPLWRASLKEAIAADPDHVSVYDLQVARSYVGPAPVTLGSPALLPFYISFSMAAANCRTPPCLILLLR